MLFSLVPAYLVFARGTQIAEAISAIESEIGISAADPDVLAGSGI